MIAHKHFKAATRSAGARVGRDEPIASGRDDDFARALRLLDTDEQQPSLRVHRLQGKGTGVWSASASDELRITFERLANGRKMLLRASRPYR